MYKPTVPCAQKMNKKTISNVLRIDEPWFSLIRSGAKRVEGRRGTLNKFNDWVGQFAVFHSDVDSLRVIVTAVRHYNNLYDYLAGEDWHIVAPHLSSIEETISAYHEIYTDTDILVRDGICAIEFIPLDHI